MKTFLTFPVFILTGYLSFTQLCGNDSTGLVPLTDLLSGTYRGNTGGLYFGDNTKPLSHQAALNSIINNFDLLDTNGNVDNVNGKLLLVSIGASNPATEFANFKGKADTFSLINPDLEIINGCKGGVGIQKMIDLQTTTYWTYVAAQLATGNCTKEQVQIIWLEEENTQNGDTAFPRAVDTLMYEFKQLFQIMMNEYPNLKICYLTARAYAGYAEPDSVGTGLLFPRDYYNGWGLKWLIRDQINGDTSLAWTGTNIHSPLLTWATYLWSDANTPRNDGFALLCPTDVKVDGLHLNSNGQEKAGRMLFDFFRTDTEAKQWFLNNPPASVFGPALEFSITTFPNPVSVNLNIETDYQSPIQAIFFDMMGKKIFETEEFQNQIQLNLKLATGMFLLKLMDADQQIGAKLILKE